MLLMDVKRAFDYLSKNELMRKIKAIETDSDLLRWTDLFMSEKMVSLVIHSHQLKEVEMGTGVLQGSSVSPILFLAHLSDIFTKVEKDVEECMTTLATDDCG